MLSIRLWAEFVVIALIAIVIIPPKDWPKVLFKLGRLVQKLQSITTSAYRSLSAFASMGQDDSFSQSLKKPTTPPYFNEDSHER